MYVYLLLDWVLLLFNFEEPSLLFFLLFHQFGMLFSDLSCFLLLCREFLDDACVSVLYLVEVAELYSKDRDDVADSSLVAL